MMYWALSALAAIFGYETVVAICRRDGRLESAWSMASEAERKKLLRDPTYTYTFEAAAKEVELAVLALEAKSVPYAHEWAILSSACALAIFRWKGELDSPEAQNAIRLLDHASKLAHPERASELLRLVEKAEVTHNTVGELRFKQQIAAEEKHRWIRSMRGISRPKLSDRPI